MAGFGRAKKEKTRQQTSLRNEKSLLRRAIEFHKQGDLHNAEKNYRSAIKSGLKDFNLLFNLGLICQEVNAQRRQYPFTKKQSQSIPVTQILF